MNAILIPHCPDFSQLLAIAQQALGYSLAAAIDASPVQRTELERFVSCLAAMHDEPPGLKLLSHATVSVLVAAEEGEMLSLLEQCELPFVVADTTKRGIQLAVITGTLEQWKAAIDRGAELRSLFLENNLNLWYDYLRLT